MLDHQIAVSVAVFQAKAFLRDNNDRHLDVIEDLNQRVTSPNLWLADTITRLGRHNALAIGMDRHVVNHALRTTRERLAA